MCCKHPCEGLYKRKKHLRERTREHGADAEDIQGEPTVQVGNTVRNSLLINNHQYNRINTEGNKSDYTSKSKGIG